MGDAHDLLDELDDSAVYTPSSPLLSLWLLLGSMLVWLCTGLGCSNTGGCCSTGRSGEGGGAGGDAVSSSSSFWSIMSMGVSCVLDDCVGTRVVVCGVFLLLDEMDEMEDMEDVVLRCVAQFPAAAGTIAMSSEVRRRDGMVRLSIRFKVSQHAYAHTRLLASVQTPRVGHGRRLRKRRKLHLGTAPTMNVRRGGRARQQRPIPVVPIGIGTLGTSRLGCAQGTASSSCGLNPTVDALRRFVGTDDSTMVAVSPIVACQHLVDGRVEHKG